MIKTKVGLLFMAATFALTGCSGAAQDDSGTQAAEDPFAPSEKAPAVTDEQATVLLQDLEAVQPGLGAPESIELARKVCEDVLFGAQEDILIASTREMFSTEEAPFKDEQVLSIISTVKNSEFCNVL